MYAAHMQETRGILDPSTGRIVDTSYHSPSAASLEPISEHSTIPIVVYRTDIGAVNQSEATTAHSPGLSRPESSEDTREAGSAVLSQLRRNKSSAFNGDAWKRLRGIAGFEE